MSAFQEWFEAQHGRRRPHANADSDDILRQKIHVGEMAARELKRRQEWDSRKESALYAWQAVTQQFIETQPDSGAT